MSILPNRIFLIGMMGAGKTYWARMLAAHYKVSWFDTDQMVEAIAGEPINLIFLRENGEEVFREMERKVIQETDWPELCIISCGGGLPVYHKNMDYMLQNGVVVWLNPDPEVLVNRLWTEKSRRPLVASSAGREALAEKLNDLIAERNPFYRRAHKVIDSSMPDLVEIIRAIEG